MPEILADIISILGGTLRLATPLILCAMAGLISERSGVIDIGLEGKLLAGAFAAATVAYAAGTATPAEVGGEGGTLLGIGAETIAAFLNSAAPWLGLFAAILVSIGFALIHGFACITHRGEQIISGVAINILAAGLTIVIGHALFGRGGVTPDLTTDQTFNNVTLPFAEGIGTIPILGPIYQNLISGQNLLVYVALAVVAAVSFLLYRTTFGLRVRAVGEAPAAVDTAGISVPWLRYRALIIAGALCGIAGAYLSTGHGAGFEREMSAGKGFIALAAMIFGNWRPGMALFACLLFGFLDTIGPRLQGVEIPLIGEAPVALIPVLPYIFTVILLAGFFGRATPPRALGTPYVKEH